MKVSEDEKKNQIALSLIEGVGDKIGKKLLAYFGSAKAIFLSSKSDLEKVDGIGKVLVNSIINTNVLSKAVEELKFIEEQGIQHLSMQIKIIQID
jgi:DNA processing protein